MPEELIDEVERTNNRQNGAILTQYMNEVLFVDYKVICCTGMREFFVLTAQQRESSFKELRASSLRSRKDGSQRSDSYSGNRALSFPENFGA